MNTERLKGWLSSSSKLVAASAQLAKKQAELATLNNVTLPRLYHAIGKRIIGSTNLPPDLVPHRDKIRELEAAIATKSDGPKSEPASGFAAKAKQLAQQAASKTAKATADAAATVKIQAAYVALGKRAIAKYGPQALPTDLGEQYEAAMQKQAALVGDIATVNAFTGKRLATPGRLVLLVLIGAAGAGAFVSYHRPSALLTDAAATREQPSAAPVSGSMETETDDIDEPPATARAEARSASRRDFTGQAPMTSEDLIEAIQAAPDITHLNLIYSDLLNDKCLPAIASLEHLQYLDFGHSRQKSFTAEGLAVLRGKKMAAGVTFPNALLEDEKIFDIYCSMLAEQEVLDLRRWSFGDAGAVHVRNVGRLRQLTLPTTSTDTSLMAMKDVRGLQQLTVRLNDHVTSRGIAALRGCGSLKSLAFDVPPKASPKSAVVAKGLRGLKGLGLDTLILPTALKTEECFAPFLDSLAPGAHSQHHISFCNDEASLEWPPTAKALRALEGRRGIDHIIFNKCTGNDADLEPLGHMPDLETLHIMVSSYDGSGLSSLRNCRSLTKVFVSQCKNFSDKGLEALADAPNLEDLRLDDVPKVTDGGLLSLQRCKTLKVLVVGNTGASGKFKVTLEKALPECRISVEN